MTTDIHLTKKRQKIQAFESALPQKFGIEPFTCKTNLVSVCDSGSLFDTKVLDITDDVFPEKLVTTLNVICNLPLVLHLSSQASVTHSMVNVFKACIAVMVELEKYTFKTAEVHKAYQANHSAFAGSGGSSGATAAKMVVKEEVAETMVETTEHHCTLVI